jgi:Na+/citrate or Na+/malate symporter
VDKACRKSYEIMGMSPPLFIIVSIVIFTGSYLRVLPEGMTGAFALMFVLGGILGEIGNRMPVLNTYLGGGPIVILFGSALLVNFKVLPLESTRIITDFLEGGEFLNFYIIALITGSIMAMNRKLIVKSAIGFLLSILACTVVALIFVCLGGAIMGYGTKRALFFIGLPVLSGGMGAGAVPLSEIYGSMGLGDPPKILSSIVPAIEFSNVLSIIAASLLNGLGKIRKNLSGNGELMPPDGRAAAEAEVREPVDYKNMGTGLLISLAFFILSMIIGKYVTSIHFFAWMIILVAAVKATAVMPRHCEESVYQWYQFVMINLTYVTLAGIGIAYTNLHRIIDALTLQYLILVSLTVLGAVLGAGVAGRFVGFFPIESSITAGLCMTNLGGTGDVAVLSACNRMNLMPFAQISSRIGGAFVLLLASALLAFLH